VCVDLNAACKKWADEDKFCNVQPFAATMKSFCCASCKGKSSSSAQIREYNTTPTLYMKRIYKALLKKARKSL
jgi:hypothetical protein